jgi:hypothetical protein
LLSRQGQVGLDLTLGVSGLELRWLPPQSGGHLQMRMDAAERADAPLDRVIA